MIPTTTPTKQYFPFNDVVMALYYIQQVGMHWVLQFWVVGDVQLIISLVEVGPPLLSGSALGLLDFVLPAFGAQVV